MGFIAKQEQLHAWDGGGRRSSRISEGPVLLVKGSLVGKPELLVMRFRARAGQGQNFALENSVGLHTLRMQTSNQSLFSLKHDRCFVVHRNSLYGLSARGK